MTGFISNIFNKYIPKAVASLAVLVCATAFSANATASETFTVVLDPGHGGNDTGACDNNAREKDINLAVAQKVSELIQKKMRDAKVVMTRDNDTFLSLQARADIANKAKADLFVSIHTNSLDKKNRNRTTVSGSSVYALGLHKDDNNMNVARRENSVIELENDYDRKYSGFDPNKDESYIIFEMAQKKNLSQSIRFADDVQKQLVSTAGRRDRGVHQAGFWVLWATSMPSVLIELDFICNPESAKYLTSKRGVDELAEAIFNAIQAFSQNQVQKKRMQDSAIASPAADPDRKDKSHAQLRATESSSAGNSTRSRKRRGEEAREASNSSIQEVQFIEVLEEDDTLASTSDNELFNDDLQLLADTGVSSSKENSKNSKKNKNGKGNQKESNRSKSTAHKAKIQKYRTIYTIQLCSSPSKLTENNPMFGGFKPVSAIWDNNEYRYTYGASQDKKEIEDLLKEVKRKVPQARMIHTRQLMN